MSTHQTLKEQDDPSTPFCLTLTGVLFCSLHWANMRTYRYRSSAQHTLTTLTKLNFAVFFAHFFSSSSHKRGKMFK